MACCRYSTGSVRTMYMISAGSFDPRDVQARLEMCRLCGDFEDSPKHFFTACRGCKHGEEKGVKKQALVDLCHLRSRLHSIWNGWFEWKDMLNYMYSTNKLKEEGRVRVQENMDILDNMFMLRSWLIHHKDDGSPSVAPAPRVS
jgi:hypothetical protein